MFGVFIPIWKGGLVTLSAVIIPYILYTYQALAKEPDRDRSTCVLVDCSTSESRGFCCYPRSNEPSRDLQMNLRTTHAAELREVRLAFEGAESIVPWGREQGSYADSEVVVGAVVIEAMERGPNSLPPLTVVVDGVEADDNGSDAIVASVRPGGALVARLIVFRSPSS